MSILDWLFAARWDGKAALWAAELAERRHHHVWARLAARAGQLGSDSEARGYIRCRALCELRGGLRTILGTSQLTPQLELRILQRAQDLLASRFAFAMVRPAVGLERTRRAA
jgi:hypothetical protein